VRGGKRELRGKEKRGQRRVKREMIVFSSTPRGGSRKVQLCYASIKGSDFVIKERKKGEEPPAQQEACLKRPRRNAREEGRK